MARSKNDGWKCKMPGHRVWLKKKKKETSIFGYMHLIQFTRFEEITASFYNNKL